MKGWFAAFLVPLVTLAAAYAFVLLAPARTIAALPSWVPHLGRRLDFQALGGSHLVLQAADPAKAAEAAAVVARRLAGLGVGNASVNRQGDSQIVVEAPGYNDDAGLAALLTDNASLAFQMVDDSAAPGGPVPPGDELAPAAYKNCSPDCSYLLDQRPVVTGEMIVDASPIYDQSGQPAVAFRLDARGKLRLAQVTADSVGRRFAVVLDGKVVTAPMIQGPITGGQGEITGAMTQDATERLALLLRSGALPTSLRVVERRLAPPGG